MQIPYDIVALEFHGHNVAIPMSDAGEAWVKSRHHAPDGFSFLTFLSQMPDILRIGVLDPTGNVLNFTSHPLH